MKSLGKKCWVLTLLVVALAWSVSGQTIPDKSQQGGAPDRFETVRAAVQKWLAKPDYNLAIISPAYLKDTILGNWDKLQAVYQIVSVRKPDDDVSAGRIPHAINIYWPGIANDTNLAKLDTGKTLVLYCYYGNSSMISWTILTLMGYCSQSLNFGMMNWNADALVKAPWDREADHPVDTVTYQPQESFHHPVLASAETDVKSIIRERARKYLAGEGSPVISSSSVSDIVGNWDEMKARYQILDVRSEADYKRGHIPNAINMPLPTLADARQLTRLDPTREALVYSENGQTGAVGATVLNLLGYRAVNMQFGMMDWNTAYVDPAKVWDKAAGYEVER